MCGPGREVHAAICDGNCSRASSHDGIFGWVAREYGELGIVCVDACVGRTSKNTDGCRTRAPVGGTEIDRAIIEVDGAAWMQGPDPLQGSCVT